MKKAVSLMKIDGKNRGGMLQIRGDVVLLCSFSLLLFVYINLVTDDYVHMTYKMFCLPCLPGDV